jgi:hypothetical protein
MAELHATLPPAGALIKNRGARRRVHVGLTRGPGPRPRWAGGHAVCVGIVAFHPERAKPRGRGGDRRSPAQANRLRSLEIPPKYYHLATNQLEFRRINTAVQLAAASANQPTNTLTAGGNKGGIIIG